jgi:hypothetical protein
MMLPGGLSPSLDAAMPIPSGRTGRIVERLVVERVGPPAMLREP